MTKSDNFVLGEEMFPNEGTVCKVLLPVLYLKGR
jgi:hypothetical protein